MLLAGSVTAIGVFLFRRNIYTRKAVVRGIRSQSQRGVAELNFNKPAPEIEKDLKDLVRNYETRIDLLVKECNRMQKNPERYPPKSIFKASFGKLADADGDAALASGALTIPALVSSDPKARTASSEAKKKLKEMWSKTYARSDLYQCLKKAADGADTNEESRLVEVTLAKFQQSGAAIEDEEQRRIFTELEARCSRLTFQIEQNINEDNTEIELTDEELLGCDGNFINALKQKSSTNDNATGSARLCSVKAPIAAPIMKRAKSATTRRKMLQASQGRCAEKNSQLLDDLLAARHEAALLLGFSSHAERMLQPKMAGSVERARSFCSDMLARLRTLRDAEMDTLARQKAVELGSSSHGEEESRVKVEAWDISYLSDILKREELQLDDEQTKEFFPLEGTINRILAVYSDFLGLSFSRLSTAPVWHEDVVVFEVRRQIDDQIVGHLYLDQFPREGKFGHQMIVPLSPSFVNTDSGTRYPCAVCPEKLHRVVYMQLSS